MAQDETNFASMRLWEILLAPSVTQRKVAQAVSALDRRLGGFLYRIVEWFDRHFVKASNVMHKMSLMIPEEDEYFLIHQGATIISGLFFGFPKAAYPFVAFDTHLSRAEKRKVMRFYRHCLQRHLFAHREQRRILSKNPYFSPKVDALIHHLPDAKIIYLARNPLQVVPSYASLSAHWWRLLAEPRSVTHTLSISCVRPNTGIVIRERLEQAPRRTASSSTSTRWIADPEKVLTENLQPLWARDRREVAAVLREASERATNTTSRPCLSLEGAGFTASKSCPTMWTSLSGGDSIQALPEITVWPGETCAITAPWNLCVWWTSKSCNKEVV